MHQYLIQNISQDYQLNEEDKELVIKYFEETFSQRGQILEEQGRVPQYLYYLISGFVRLFYFDEDGNEVTTHINCPKGFITSYFDFSNQTVSDLNVAAITDCRMLRITKPDLDRLIQESSVFRDYSTYVFVESIRYHEERSKDLATLSAEQRYLKLLKNQPEIIQNVPLQIIASFLGVKPESLSRIRRNIIT